MTTKRRSTRRRANLTTLTCTILILLALAAATDSIMKALERQDALPQVPFPAVSAAGAPEEPAEEDGDDDWMLRLVNPWNPMPQTCEVTLTQLKNDQAVDERCYPDLQAMMDACRAAGLSPLICSSYRSGETQTALYRSKAAEFAAQGLDSAAAAAEAGKVVAVPGASEHQLGLAVDIVDESYQHLDARQESTVVQRWLLEHCWEYGFILRYPADKSELTGIVYEPWHYRYVGRAAAREIREQGVCLEEYLASR